MCFPQGDAHVLSSAPGMRAAPDMSRFARRVDAAANRLRARWRRRRARSRRLRLSRLRRASVQSAAHRAADGDSSAGGGSQATSGWLGTLLNIALKESGSARAGSENVLARLSELMFVEAIRRYLETLPPSADRLARGAARSGRRTGALRAARRTERIVDGRTAGATRRRYRVRSLPSASRRWSASRRCSTWRCGGCSSPPACCSKAGRSRRSPTPSATNPKRRSAAHSRSWSARRRRRGGEERQQ